MFDDCIDNILAGKKGKNVKSINKMNKERKNKQSIYQRWKVKKQENKSVLAITEQKAAQEGKFRICISIIKLWYTL